MRVFTKFQISMRICLFLATLSFAPSLLAQAGAEFQITKIEPAIVTTPLISYSGATIKRDDPKKWMEIEVSFSWQPRNPAEKYSDDVVFNYFVLLANRSVTYPQGTMLTGQVTHNSIPSKQKEQSDLRSVMYISPRSLERFFADTTIPSTGSMAVVDIGVTISKQGQIVAQKSLHATSGAWWPQYQQTAGYLLNKNQTPFATLNPDYYEPVKPQQQQ